jgi:hypothetical protein
VLGLATAAMTMTSPAEAQDLGKLDLSKVGAGASANGVVMSQDEASVYIYDSSKERAIIISKTVKVNSESGVLFPQTFVINTKTMSVTQVHAGK